MLSVFDTIFVVTATISFSLPILSHSWNVNIWLVQVSTQTKCLTNIPWHNNFTLKERFYEVFFAGDHQIILLFWDFIPPVSFSLSVRLTGTLEIILNFFENFYSLSFLLHYLTSSPPSIKIFLEGKCLASNKSLNFQTFVHPFLFPWLSPILQISLNGSIWATVSVAIERFISIVHPRFW